MEQYSHSCFRRSCCYCLFTSSVHWRLASSLKRQSIDVFILVDSDGTLQMGLALLGKFSISASFCILFAYTPELYSTDVRL